MKDPRRKLFSIGAVVLGLATLAIAAGPDLPEGAVVLTATVKAKPGQEDAVKQALLSLVGPTRKEPGCIVYNLHQSKTDPTMFMFYEQWASQEALDAHGASAHMKAMRPKVEGKTEAGGGLVRYDLLK